MFRPIGAPSIPPELLENIFLDVVESASTSDRALTALELSHICRTFRHAAVNCARLWTCLDRKRGRPALALIEECIKRSRGLPLDVTLYFYSYRKPVGESKEVIMLAVDRIARILIPISNRWRSLSVRFLVDQYSEQHVIIPNEFTLSTGYLKAPILEELSIEDASHFKMWMGSSPYDAFFWSWNLPALHSIITHNICPSTIFPKFHSQLQTLKSSFSGGENLRMLSSLPAFLESTAFKEIHFSFNAFCFDRPRTNPRVLFLPRLEALHITFANCSRVNSPRCGLRSVFDFYQFSALGSLSIVLYIGSPTFVSSNGYDMTLVSFLVVETQNFYGPHYLRFPSTLR